MYLVGFIIRIHNDARSSECQIRQINSPWHRIKVQEAIRNYFKNIFYQIEKKIISVMTEYFR